MLLPANSWSVLGYKSPGVQMIGHPVHAVVPAQFPRPWFGVPPYPNRLIGGSTAEIEVGLPPLLPPLLPVVVVVVVVDGRRRRRVRRFRGVSHG